MPILIKGAAGINAAEGENTNAGLAPGRKSSLSEVHVTLEVYESWVRVEAVESWVDVEKHHPVGALLKSLLQPLKPVVIVFEADVSSRDVVRRDVPLSRELDEIIQLLLRFLLLTRESKSAGILGPDQGRATRSRNRLFKFFNGLLVHSLLRVRESQIPARCKETRIQLHGLLALTYRLVPAVRKVIYKS